MGIARILIGLLLVILPATQSRSNEISVANSNGLQQSQVAASQVKENLYPEFALIETQEKASDVATGDVDSQDFGGWLPPFFDRHHFQNLFWLKELSTYSGYTLSIAASLPRYILYHSLIIPF